MVIDHNLDPILSERELAAWLGISLPSLQRMRSNGCGPRFVQLSQRRIGYRKSVVERWLDARSVARIGALASSSVTFESTVAPKPPLHHTSRPRRSSCHE